MAEELSEVDLQSRWRRQVGIELVDEVIDDELDLDRNWVDT